MASSAVAFAGDPAAGFIPLYRRPEPPRGASIEVRAVGDVMLGRSVAELVTRRGAERIFSGVRSSLAGDLVIGNLESPLTTAQISRAGPYRFSADPTAATALARAGFGAMSVANNHALDCGPGGLSDSIASLEGAAVRALGPQPVEVTASGLRVAMFAFNDVLDPEDTSGAPHAPLDEHAFTAIRAARARAAAVIVMMHWGREYSHSPSPRQIELAERLVASGVDLVIGAHPHVLQPAVAIEAGGRTGFVAYSLGNFVFDQNHREDTARSIILRAIIDESGVQRAEFAPLHLERAAPQPVPTDSALARTIEAELAALTLERIEEHALSPGRPLSAAAAWRWYGEDDRAEAVNASVDQGTLRRIARRTTPTAGIPVDLRGDGRPLYATLTEGLLEIRDGASSGAPIVWRNEGPSWRVLRIAPGDPDGDGRIELFLLLAKIARDGTQTTHPFLLGWRKGRYRIIWGGSATRVPIHDAALGDLDGDGREELAVLDREARVSVWRWHGWGFERRWRSERVEAHSLGLADTPAGTRMLILVAH